MDHMNPDEWIKRSLSRNHPMLGEHAGELLLLWSITIQKLLMATSLQEHWRSKYIIRSHKLTSKSVGFGTSSLTSHFSIHMLSVVQFKRVSEQQPKSMSNPCTMTSSFMADLADLAFKNMMSHYMSPCLDIM